MTQQRTLNMQCIVGGTGEEKPATEEIQRLVDGLKKALVNQTGRKNAKFTAKSYKSQVVAGTNYFIKVQVGEHDYIHIHVHKNLPCNGGEISLHSIQDKKSHDDPVEYF